MTNPFAFWLLVVMIGWFVAWGAIFVMLILTMTCSSGVSEEDRERIDDEPR